MLTIAIAQLYALDKSNEILLHRDHELDTNFPSSLVPRLSMPPVFDHLRYTPVFVCLQYTASYQKLERHRRPGNELGYFPSATIEHKTFLPLGSALSRACFCDIIATTL